MTLDTPHEPAPETEVEHPEFPLIEIGRGRSVILALLTDAMFNQKIDPQDAVEARRFLDSAY
jgi:hypothetical protein